jgi:hypothetical protein
MAPPQSPEVGRCISPIALGLGAGLRFSIKREVRVDDCEAALRPAAAHSYSILNTAFAAA